MASRNTNSAMLPNDRGVAALSMFPLLKPFELAREKVIAGWLRLAFFASILFNHTVLVRFEFLDERMWVVWAQLLRDFGAVGFFVLAGVSLKGKILANHRVRVPSNLLKLAIAAAALAAFDMLWTVVKGQRTGSFADHFYVALYDTNLWFFVAYAFAGPMLLSLDRRGTFWTAVCCLGFIMFPASLPLTSPYILQTISLAFVCMAIGMGLHGRQANASVAFMVAAIAYLARVWTDDFGAPADPALDIVLRITYGVACYLLLKAFADRLCRHIRPPGWANYLFVPYVLQFPIVAVVTAFLTAVLAGSLNVNMPPIFVSFGEALSFMLAIFAISMVASLGVAWLLCRHRIRV